MTDFNAASAEPAPADDMGAIYDQLAADGIETEEQDAPAEAAEQPAEAQEAEAAPEQPEKAEEPQQAAPEAPTELPASIKAKWADMTPEAQEAVLSSHRDMTRRMADQGRVVQAAKPIYDVLVNAAKEIPTLADMTPQQIAQDVFAMAKIQGQLAQDPVKTILGIAQQYGALDGIRQAIGGQNPDQTAQQNMALVQEVRSLKAQLAQVVDPNTIDQRVNQTLAARDTERLVTEYASSKPHWADAEPFLPQMIQLAQARLGEGASPKDVLEAAYDMAIHAIPDLRAKATTPAPAAAMPDPARTAAQQKAKSINVGGRPTGDAKPPTGRAAMAAIWDRLANE